jgi:hypothetical protein
MYVVVSLILNTFLCGWSNHRCAAVRPGIDAARSGRQGPQGGGSDVFLGERRAPTFLPGERRPPLPKSNVGERRSPWQGLNMSEVQ